MRYVIASGLLATIATFVGCSQAPSAAAGAATVNEQCPIMGGAVTPDGGRADWNGQTVGFCCPGCIEKWNALSEEEKKAALAKAENEHDDHSHDSHDPDHPESGGAKTS